MARSSLRNHLKLPQNNNIKGKNSKLLLDTIEVVNLCGKYLEDLYQGDELQDTTFTISMQLLHRKKYNGN